MPALSLSKLVDLALGTPEVGAVNFNILHSLLHAMIQHLKISDVTADITESDRDFLSGPEKMQLLNSLAGGNDDSQDTQGQKSGTDLLKHRPAYHQLEFKVAKLAEQLEQLDALPSTSELFQKIKATGDRPTPVSDLWQSMQINKRVGANEEGVGKLMTMVEDLMREMTQLKDGYSRMGDIEEQIKKLRDENNNLKNKLDNLGLQDLQNRLNDLDSCMKDLNEKFEQLPDYSYLPSAEDFAAFVTWPGLEDALNGVRMDMAELSRRPELPKVSSVHLPSQTEVAPVGPARTVSRPASSRPSTRMSSASSGPSDQILEILERLGKICDEHAMLEKRVETLEEEMKKKVDKEFLEQTLDGLNMNLLDDLTKQLDQIKTDVANLQKEMQANREQDKPVLIKPKGAVFDPSSGISSVHDIATPFKKGSAMLPPLPNKPIFDTEAPEIRTVSAAKVLVDSSTATHVCDGREVLGKKVADLEEQLQILQEYLLGDVAKCIDEYNVDATSSQTDLCESGKIEHELPNGCKVKQTMKANEDGKRQGTERPLVAKTFCGTERPQGTAIPEGTDVNRGETELPADIHNSELILSACDWPESNGRLNNLGRVLNSELRGVKERLFHMADDYKNIAKGLEQAMSKARKAGASKTDPTDGQEHDVEALMRAHQAISRLREDVDKLQVTTQEIISENDTRNKQIESLFQYCDKLHDVKADKEYVAMEVDVKADKRHLDGKVNHSLFDSATAEINRLIKEIQDKLNGNEFDWKEAIAKLSEELESKLDRMELNALKEWLESRLKALNQKIKQAGRYEEDDAAGIRKQLLQRFHCISCDRPVDIMTSGPIPSIPTGNGLPPTRSPRPYTTYELDQIRQHAKSLQGDGGVLLSSFPYMVRQEKAHVMGKNAVNYERALAQRHMARMRKCDLRRFMMQQYQSEACRGDVDELVGQEATELYAHDRPCGGSHTLTYPHKRVTRLSHLSHLFQNEPVVPAPAPVAFKHDSELDILGVDGHIYKGRINKQDPSRRHPMVATYTPMSPSERSPPISPHMPVRPSTSAGVNKPTTTPVPPATRPRPTSAVPRPSSGGSVPRVSSSARLTMRPQSARASSGGGSGTPSPPPEEPREFLPTEEQVSQPEAQPDPVEVPVDTPRDEEFGDSANVEE